MTRLDPGRLSAAIRDQLAAKLGEPERRRAHLTEAEWQADVIDLAHSAGWRHLHCRRSIGKGRQWVTATNVQGWPDLLMWHPARGGIIAAELKVDKNKPTPEQRAVLAELASAGVPAFVWYPADIDEVTGVLVHGDHPQLAALRTLRS